MCDKVVMSKQSLVLQANVQRAQVQQAEVRQAEVRQAEVRQAEVRQAEVQRASATRVEASGSTGARAMLLRGAVVATALSMAGCNGAFWGNLVVLGVTIGIFFGTLALGRTTAAARSADASSSTQSLGRR
jgi:hypothetical protein